ncbi:MAG: type II toxin-antitoxin system Phd/YefM family antitoxin [Firmicutes bacterium]|nr:type II toxin-antitoxin system Phd/YefM family antitoxin [Bacillota bacterium]
MKTVPITQARNNLYKLLDETILSSEPIEILGKRGNGILLSKQDWISIQETLYLLSIPGMRESLIEGRNTPEEELLDLEDIGWDLD